MIHLMYHLYVLHHDISYGIYVIYGIINMMNCAYSMNAFHYLNLLKTSSLIFFSPPKRLLYYSLKDTLGLKTNEKGKKERIVICDNNICVLFKQSGNLKLSVNFKGSRSRVGQ